MGPENRTEPEFLDNWLYGIIEPVKEEEEEDDDTDD